MRPPASAPAADAAATADCCRSQCQARAELAEGLRSPGKDGKQRLHHAPGRRHANNQFLGSFLLRDDPGQESRLLAVAAVPLGVLLPFGLTWQIDGGKPIRVPYMLCDPQSCATQLVINEAYVNSLKKGSKLTLTAKNRKNEDLTININLAGFTAVYDGEAALTFDEFSKRCLGRSRSRADPAGPRRAAPPAAQGDGTAAAAPAAAPSSQPPAQ